MMVRSHSRALRAPSRTVGWVVAGAGCLVLTGWALDSAVLQSLIPGAPSIPPLVAAGFLAAGVSLWMSQADPVDPRSQPQRPVAFVTAALVVLPIPQPCPPAAPGGRVYPCVPLNLVEGLLLALLAIIGAPLLAG